jgi:hypothetical protein
MEKQSLKTDFYQNLCLMENLKTQLQVSLLLPKNFRIVMAQNVESTMALD